MNNISLRTDDRDTPQQEQLLPIVIVLDRLRSAYNVGNIFRLAEACRAKKIICCGYTPTPPHDKLAKTARDCDLLVESVQMETSLEAVKQLKAKGYRVYAVETVNSAKYFWNTKLSFPAAFVFGNEALGINEDTLKICDEFICLPSLGRKNSINVANCCSAVIFEAVKQWLENRE
jgi:23S rRNA (guanosine2251-2'-O)-methyltransferase